MYSLHVFSFFKYEPLYSSNDFWNCSFQMWVYGEYLSHSTVSYKICFFLWRTKLIRHDSDESIPVSAKVLQTRHNYRELFIRMNVSTYFPFIHVLIRPLVYRWLQFQASGYHKQCANRRSRSDGTERAVFVYISLPTPSATCYQHFAFSYNVSISLEAVKHMLVWQ